MTEQNFSRPGAIDLSGLAAKADQEKALAAGANYVLELTQEQFQQVAQDSMRYPIIMAFYSPRDPNGSKVLDALSSLANQAAGKWLLARVNVDEQQAIAQALGVQAVPTVVALIAGQVAPLFQGTQEKEQIAAVVQQIEQVAVANGLTGRAEPVKQTEVDQDGNTFDPRFKAADEALQQGDFKKAVEEFDRLLQANPKDAEAQAGKAQAGLLARSADADPAVIAKADAHPNDIELALEAADVQMIQGHFAAAFTRLINLIKQSAGDERETLRVRLLELFDTVAADDPEVAKARRELSLALF